MAERRRSSLNMKGASWFRLKRGQRLQKFGHIPAQARKLHPRVLRISQFPCADGSRFGTDHELRILLPKLFNHLTEDLPPHLCGIRSHIDKIEGDNPSIRTSERRRYFTREEPRLP